MTDETNPSASDYYRAARKIRTTADLLRQTGEGPGLLLAFNRAASLLDHLHMDAVCAGPAPASPKSPTDWMRENSTLAADAVAGKFTTGKDEPGGKPSAEPAPAEPASKRSALVARTIPEFCEHLRSTANRARAHQQPVVYGMLLDDAASVIEQISGRADLSWLDDTQPIPDQLRDYGEEVGPQPQGLVRQAANRIEWLQDALAEALKPPGDWTPVHTDPALSLTDSIRALVTEAINQGKPDIGVVRCSQDWSGLLLRLDSLEEAQASPAWQSFKAGWNSVRLPEAADVAVYIRGFLGRNDGTGSLDVGFCFKVDDWRALLARVDVAPAILETTSPPREDFAEVPSAATSMTETERWLRSGLRSADIQGREMNSELNLPLMQDGVRTFLEHIDRDREALRLARAELDAIDPDRNEAFKPAKENVETCIRKRTAEAYESLCQPDARISVTTSLAEWDLFLDHLEELRVSKATAPWWSAGLISKPDREDITIQVLREMGSEVATTDESLILATAAALVQHHSRAGGDPIELKPATGTVRLQFVTASSPTTAETTKPESKPLPFLSREAIPAWLNEHADVISCQITAAVCRAAATELETLRERDEYAKRVEPEVKAVETDAMAAENLDMNSHVIERKFPGIVLTMREGAAEVKRLRAALLVAEADAAKPGPCIGDNPGTQASAGHYPADAKPLEAAEPPHISDGNGHVARLAKACEEARASRCDQRECKIKGSCQGVRIRKAERMCHAPRFEGDGRLPLFV